VQDTTRRPLFPLALIELMFDTRGMDSIADLQRGGASAPTATPQLALDVERVRTFDTPEFAGMTFLEVEAKSALNRVSGMPFAWSINPYRGCSHACSYCLVVETPILMADGSTRPIATLRAGDRIWGTVRRGRQRRFVETRVSDHWRTRKAAFRVALADGSELVASGDHRLLTEHGWRHVAPARADADHPALAEADRLMGLRGDAVLSSPVATGDALRVRAVEALGVDVPMVDITTGTGDFIANGVVSHNCFARPTHAYLNLSPIGDFERQVVVKTNVVEVLRRELAKPSWLGERVALGTNTDPYQRCEGRYRLMPGIIEALAESRTPLSILTKGTLITRDVDVLTAAAEHVDVAAAFTIGMLDEALWSASEPGTPSPRARLDAVRRLNEAGIPTGVMLAPIMPGLNDDEEQLAALIDAAVGAGATHVTPIVLHLRRGARYPGGIGVREAFWPWLEREHPHLVGWYAELYRGAQAPAAYRDEVTAFVHERHGEARRRHGAPPARRALSRRPDPNAPVQEPEPATPSSEQLRLL
jgi:DNA repair photolyase